MVSTKGRLGIAVVLILAIIVAVVVMYPHHVEISAEGNGSVEPSGGTDIRFYQDLTINIVPDDGYRSEVYVDGVLKAKDVASFTFNVGIFDFSSHSIRVVFVKETPVEEKYTLTVESTGDGSVSPSGSNLYDKGTSVDVSILPSEGNVIGSITIDDVEVTPSNFLKITMDSNHKVVIVFRPVSLNDIPVIITVDVDVEIVVETLGYSGSLDFGTVTPSGTVHVVPHSSLTITVSLNDGFEINDFKVNGASHGAVTEYTVTNITAPISVELSIVKKVPGYVITASAGTGGIIYPSGQVKVAEGNTQIFTFSPSSGYKVSTLVVDGKTITVDSNSYTFEDVHGSHSISVAFTLSGGSSGEGTVTLTHIAVTTPPDKTSYTVGETFDRTGMVVTAYYSDGRSSEISGYTVDPSGGLTVENTSVTITYQGKSTDVEITVTERSLVGIEMTTYPSKISYKAGELFSPEGMVITATYSDGDREPVTGYTFSPAAFLDGGRCTVTISYTEGEVTRTCDVPVTVGYSDEVLVKVKEYSGTMVSGGSVIHFSETPNQDLGTFTGYHLQNIIPGIRQTITLEIINDSGYDLDLSLYIRTIDSTEKLSEQIQFSGTSIEPMTLHDVLDGSNFSMGSVNSGQKTTVTFVVEFLNLPDNNEVMGDSLYFTLGIRSMANTST